MISSYDKEYTLNVFTQSLKWICLFFSFFTALFLFSDKRLTSHPGGLIALIFIFQGGFLQLKEQQLMICKA